MRPASRFTRSTPAPLAPLALLLAAVSGACGSGDANVRGRGLPTAPLTAEAQARVYEAAARGAFEFGDPALSLLLDPRQLPRSVGLVPTGRLPDSVAAELKQRNAIRGSCEPPLGVTGVPHCTAARPGYIVRFSPIFALKPDSVQVYLYSQKYDTPNSDPSQALRFERVYQVVRHGDEWSAVLEGRVPKEVRGERD